MLKVWQGKKQVSVVMCIFLLFKNILLETKIMTDICNHGRVEEKPSKVILFLYILFLFLVDFYQLSLFNISTLFCPKAMVPQSPEAAPRTAWSQVFLIFRLPS